MKNFVLAMLLSVLAAPVAASDFQRIADRDNFVELIQNRDLTRFGIRLKVSDTGEITGRAFGRKVSGDWTWKSGYFCRDLFVNGDPLDVENCQTVQVNGDTMRFTSDMGQGDSADLRLK